MKRKRRKEKRTVIQWVKEEVSVSECIEKCHIPKWSESTRVGRCCFGERYRWWVWVGMVKKIKEGRK